jgi:peptide/nickel transport system substrate-binding protein
MQLLAEHGRTATAAAICAAVLSLAACAGSSGTGGDQHTTTGQYASGQTLTMILPSDPGNLNPDFTSLNVTLQVDAFLYDSLIATASNGSLEPNLATTWQGSTTTASYTLRNGITCSDGTALTASDVAANINFVGNPKNASNAIGLFVPPGATATADNATGTVTVKSPEPDAFLARDVGGLPIVCPAGLANRQSLAEGADGTGMYTLTNAVAGSQYTLTLRKGYRWGPAGVTSDTKGVPAKVVLKVVSNMTTAANLLIAGQANIGEVLGQDEQRLRAQRLDEQDMTAPFGDLWFNEKPGLPGASAAVRRALTEAVQLSQLGQVVTSDTGTPATGLVAPSQDPCRGNTVGSTLPGYNLAAAKAALTAAGWVPGPGGIRVKDGTKLAMAVYYPTGVGAGMASGAELLQQDWAGLGVQVTLRGITDAELDTAIVGGQAAWGAGLIPLAVTVPSQLVPFVSGPTPPKGTNFAYINNAAYAADVARAANQTDTAGCPDWNAAESALFQATDPVPFVDSATPTFAAGATFQLSQAWVMPSTIRMLGS